MYIEAGAIWGAVTVCRGAFVCKGLGCMEAVRVEDIHVYRGLGCIGSCKGMGGYTGLHVYKGGWQCMGLYEGAHVYRGLRIHGGAFV